MATSTDFINTVEQMILLYNDKWKQTATEETILTAKRSKSGDLFEKDIIRYKRRYYKQLDDAYILKINSLHSQRNQISAILHKLTLIHSQVAANSAPPRVLENALMDIEPFSFNRDQFKHLDYHKQDPNGHQLGYLRSTHCQPKDLSYELFAETYSEDDFFYQNDNMVVRVETNHEYDPFTSKVLNCLIVDPSEIRHHLPKKDQENGIYDFFFRIQLVGEHTISVMLSGQHSQDSPNNFLVLSREELHIDADSIDSSSHDQPDLLDTMLKIGFGHPVENELHDETLIPISNQPSQLRRPIPVPIEFNQDLNQTFGFEDEPVETVDSPNQGGFNRGDSVQNNVQQLRRRSPIVYNRDSKQTLACGDVNLLGGIVDRPSQSGLNHGHSVQNGLQLLGNTTLIPTKSDQRKQHSSPIVSTQNSKQTLACGDVSLLGGIVDRPSRSVLNRGHCVQNELLLGEETLMMTDQPKQIRRPNQIVSNQDSKQNFACGHVSLLGRIVDGPSQSRLNCGHSVQTELQLQGDETLIPIRDQPKQRGQHSPIVSNQNLKQTFGIGEDLVEIVDRPSRSVLNRGHSVQNAFPLLGEETLSPISDQPKQLRRPNPIVSNSDSKHTFGFKDGLVGNGPSQSGLKCVPTTHPIPNESIPISSNLNPYCPEFVMGSKISITTTTATSWPAMEPTSVESGPGMNSYGGIRPEEPSNLNKQRNFVKVISSTGSTSEVNSSVHNSETANSNELSLINRNPAIFTFCNKASSYAESSAHIQDERNNAQNDINSNAVYGGLGHGIINSAVAGSLGKKVDSIRKSKSPVYSFPIFVKYSNPQKESESLPKPPEDWLSVETPRPSASGTTTVISSANTDAWSEESPKKTLFKFGNSDSQSRVQEWQHSNENLPKSVTPEPHYAEPIGQSRDQSVEFINDDEAAVGDAESEEEILEKESSVESKWFWSEHCKATLEMKIKANFHFPIGVAFNASTNTYIIADTFHNQIKIFDLQGEMLHNFGSPGTGPTQFLHPSAVVVYDDGCYVIKDNKQIQIYSPQNEHITSFGKHIFGKPYGLAINPEDRIVTLNVSHMSTLCIFSKTGELLVESEYTPLRSNPPNSKCRFLAVNATCVIVSDLGLSKMYVTDYQGQTLVTFGVFGHRPGQLCEPSGVAFDCLGNVILADSKNNRVQVYNNAFQFQKELELSHPIRRPSGIHLTPDGKLLILNYLDANMALYLLD